jgi:hypothetical protein
MVDSANHGNFGVLTSLAFVATLPKTAVCHSRLNKNAHDRFLFLVVFAKNREMALYKNVKVMYHMKLE